MHLGYLAQDVTSTDIGTTTSFVDSSGNPIDTSAPSMAGPNPLDQQASQAVSANTDVFGNVDLTSVINSIAKGYVSVQQAINAGNLPPGTLLRPTPGTVQLAGGITKTVNLDGSTTFTDAQGNKQTILPTGQVVQGGASALSNIPPGTLLIAGIALLGILVRMGGK